jgi:hypothetical protein
MVHLAIQDTPAQQQRLDLVTLTLAALLFISPWLMNYADYAIAAQTAWIASAVVAFFSIIATIHFAKWEEWINFLCGIGLLAAPWVLHFNRDGDAVAAFVGIGAFIVAVTGSELWCEDHPPRLVG